MKKLHIHIGPHKTGTSSLQHFLHQERDALSTAGICYPSGNLHGWPAHHRLALALKGRNDKRNGGRPVRDDEATWIVNEARQSTAGTVIISSEEFFSVDKEGVDYLAETFSDFDIHAIFYARRQDDLFVSSYAQKIKSPKNDMVAPIYDFLDAPGKMSPDLNFFKCASNWAGVLGPSKVCARLYDSGLDIRSDFLNSIGSSAALTELSSAAHEKKVNTSPSLEALETIRTVKLDYSDVEARRKLFMQLQKHFAGGTRAGKLLSTEDRRHILEFFRGSNEKLFATYFNTPNQFAPDILLGTDQTKRLTVKPDIAAALEQIAREEDLESGGSLLGRLKRSLATLLPATAKS